MALLTDATNYEPLGVTIMNNIDVVVEFSKRVRVFEIAQLLHSIDTCVIYSFMPTCTDDIMNKMLTKEDSSVVTAAKLVKLLGKLL